ncbi:phosphopantetheine-binding protein [Bradyrhizobium sp. CCBAU 25360]
MRQIWSGVLHIENIGVNDQFISLGGDSLRAI